jgi:enhancing lycopene biosynthesis protein 2
MDGAEIHEAVFTLLALDQAGAEITCCAPDIPQAEVVDHQRGQPTVGQTRNVLTESARIARGRIKNLAEVQASDIDALIFPGGFGAAKNLCTFATDGADCSVNRGVERLVGEMLAARKPIGAICIAPAMIARILGRKDLHPKLTIGKDPATAQAINKMGGQHCECPVDEAVVDEQLKVVTCPAYMLGPGPKDVFAGIKKCVDQVLRLA